MWASRSTPAPGSSAGAAAPRPSTSSRCASRSMPRSRTEPSTVPGRAPRSSRSSRRSARSPTPRPVPTPRRVPAGPVGVDPMTTGILTLSCPDQPGLVHAVSGYLVSVRANIVESAQFEDVDTVRFFMRTRFDLLDDAHTLTAVRRGFAAVAAAYDMTWEITDAATPARTLVLVSKLGHCLNDLLFRTRVGTLPIVIPAVVSNHDDLRPVVEAAGIAYHHVPVAPEGKADA